METSVLEKMREIIKQIEEQCRGLGGKLERNKITETSEILVCHLPEPKGITRVDFEEIEGRGGTFYIETEDGYHGVEVNVGNIRTRVEALGVTGDAIYDNAGFLIPDRKTIRHFVVIPRKRRRRVIKRTDRITYSVSPNLIRIYL
ncbi:MAG TPA: hypothetical protein ENG66_05105 [Thermococcus sp.]|nr:MAG: hypothetical protein DRP04_06305 [Archaeoglobales archaeon]HDH44751.1 hypothetical protein [Thermococcus sp.]